MNWMRFNQTKFLSGGRFCLIAMLVLAAGFSAVAQSTNAPAPTRMDYSTFQIIAERNIFNPNRYPHNAEVRPKRPAPAFAPEFSLVGTMSYRKGMFAFFDGNNSDYKKVLRVTDSIAGYKIKAITLSGVELETTNKPVEIKVGSGMRQDADGDWQLTDQTESFGSSAANSSPSSDTTSTSSNAGNSSGPVSDVLKKLMERREQELK
jgi:hypothetical protein